VLPPFERIGRSSIDTVLAQISNFQAQVDAMQLLSQSLQEKLGLLERKQQQFVLRAPLSGTVYGEDLPRMSGKYFAKGSTVCRVADVQELLVRVQVPEREIGDVSVGEPVRLKTRAFPGRLF
jgi:multidrug resistance efflux pump